jgi:hypothetical protein
LTRARAGDSIAPHEMENRSVFISSVTRRDLARRRASRPAVPIQVVLAVIVLAAALGAVLAARGGL